MALAAVLITTGTVVVEQQDAWRSHEEGSQRRHRRWPCSADRLRRCCNPAFFAQGAVLVPPLTLVDVASLPRWVGWKPGLRNGKLTKLPYDPRTGRSAKANDPSTWAQRRDAEAWARQHVNGSGGGVGLELGALADDSTLSLGGLDLDTCRDPASGHLEPWAVELIERFASYTEVSPSGTGAKVFFTYTTDDLATLRGVMGTDHGKQFKRGKGDHPPAIELHLGHRYFAVTDQPLAGTSTTLQSVELRTLLWLLSSAGPDFARGRTAAPAVTASPVATALMPARPVPAEPVPDALLDRLEQLMRRRKKLAARWRGDATGLRDSSRSGMDLSMMALLSRAGFTCEEATALLLRWPHGAGAERADDARYFSRMWERANHPRPESTATDGRPLIQYVQGQVQGIVDTAEDALIRADLGIYQRSTFLVRPGQMQIAIAGDRMATSQLLMHVGDHALVEALDTAARWERFDGRSEEWVPVNAPMSVAKVYKDRAGRWRVPVIAGIINAPTLRPDGSILQTPGYDATTCLLYEPQGTRFPAIADTPDRGTAERALAVLLQLVSTFPFVGDADRSVALSALLTAVIRRSLPTAPMHAFSAPVAGSGKSLLVDLASMLATGREAAVIAQGKQSEETEKRLGALLLAGATLISIDNCDTPLGGEMLCQVLTQTVVRTRILGLSEVPELPSNAFITATGNNLVLVGDMTRRALFCQLDPGCERPEQRQFTTDPLVDLRGQRGRYLAAALTVLRAYHVAGRPQQCWPLGSFGDWSGWVRSSLVWLGQADPVVTMEAVRQQDPELEDLTTVVTQWWTVLGLKEVSTSELIGRATETYMAMALGPNGGGEREYRHPEFREALLKVAGNRGAVDSHRLGMWLNKRKNREVGGHRILRAGMTAGSPRWQLTGPEAGE